VLAAFLDLAVGILRGYVVQNPCRPAEMLAHMNEESFRQTLETGEAVYWSRSRQELWRKGESSGKTQAVKSLLIDCDGDAVLLRVEQRGGAACHTGKRSCFFRRLENGQWIDVGEQVFDPEEVYGR